MDGWYSWIRCKNHYSAQAKFPFLFISSFTAPCVPRNAKGQLDCVSNSAWVTWDASEGALSYFVQAQEVGGHNSSCTTTSSPCNIPDLKCGMIYIFHVTAVNKHCHSNQSTTFELETGIKLSILHFSGWNWLTAERSSIKELLTMFFLQCRQNRQPKYSI